MLAPPHVAEVRCCGAIPAFPVFLDQRDLAQGCVHQTREVVGDQRQGLIEVDGAGDRLADVGDKLELNRVALRVFIQPRRFDGSSDLGGRRTQSFDLAPVRPPLERAVITDLEHAAGPASLVGAKRQEDADQVLVPTPFEDFACERERRIVAGVRALFLSDQACEDMSEHGTVAHDDWHLGPRRRHGDPARDDIRPVAGREGSDDCRLPGARDMNQHVVYGQ